MIAMGKARMDRKEEPNEMLALLKQQQENTGDQTY